MKNLLLIADTSPSTIDFALEKYVLSFPVITRIPFSMMLESEHLVTFPCLTDFQTIFITALICPFTFLHLCVLLFFRALIHRFSLCSWLQSEAAGEQTDGGGGSSEGDRYLSG